MISYQRKTPFSPTDNQKSENLALTNCGLNMSPSRQDPQRHNLDSQGEVFVMKKNKSSTEMLRSVFHLTKLTRKKMIRLNHHWSHPTKVEIESNLVK